MQCICLHLTYLLTELLCRDICVAGQCYDVCSLSESTAIRMANTCPEDFVNHNKRFLSRVYPNRMRVDSSNYNPQDLWNCGCQLGMNYPLHLIFVWIYVVRFSICRFFSSFCVYGIGRKKTAN